MPEPIDIERPVMAKELTDYFAKQKIGIHYAYARALIAACPHSLHGRYVRPSQAWTWWVLHPQFKPFGVKPPRAFGTRDLAE
jgi:hypothetical protein